MAYAGRRYRAQELTAEAPWHRGQLTRIVGGLGVKVLAWLLELTSRLLEASVPMHGQSRRRAREVERRKAWE
jgi:hypothetical protein